MSKILITGGAGFIGSQLGYRLSKDGHEIVLLDDLSYGYEDNLIVNKELFGTFIKMDVRSKDVYNVMTGMDYVFHFAGISSLPENQIKPNEAISINVQGDRKSTRL